MLLKDKSKPPSLPSLPSDGTESAQVQLEESAQQGEACGGMQNADQSKVLQQCRAAKPALDHLLGFLCKRIINFYLTFQIVYFRVSLLQRPKLYPN